MIANLVSNAVKYSVAGGTVDLSLESSAEGVVFVCTDNGLGISEKDRQYLFTEFFRSTNPTRCRHARPDCTLPNTEGAGGEAGLPRSPRSREHQPGAVRDPLRSVTSCPIGR